MNLHDARFALANVGMWLEAMGRTGRGIGVHIWPVEEGAPTSEPHERQPWQSVAYWTPRRFEWRPFGQAVGSLFDNGYVQPLCGRTSAARRPRAYMRQYPGQCVACLRIANERGMLVLTQASAMQQSTTYESLQTEREAWTALGRPSPWPQPQT